MNMLCTLIRGQMSYTFFQLGDTCPPTSIAWGGGQMYSYVIFHRGAHVRGIKLKFTHSVNLGPIIVNKKQKIKIK